MRSTISAMGILPFNGAFAPEVTELDRWRVQLDLRGQLLLGWAGQLRRDLQAEAIQASTAMEGVPVTVDEVRRILAGDRPAQVSPADAALVEGAEADELWTLRIASGDTRRYRAQAPRTVGRQEREVMDQRHAGLTLIACGASGNDRTIVEAALQPAALTTDD